eukprot:scaffold43597_cov69-Phaeocystis_antarctica.AAC.1
MVRKSPLSRVLPGAEAAPAVWHEELRQGEGVRTDVERAHQRRKGHILSRPEARAFVRPRRTPRLGSRSASQVTDTDLRGGHSHVPSAGLRTRSLNRSL